MGTTRREEGIWLGSNLKSGGTRMFTRGGGEMIRERGLTPALGPGGHRGEKVSTFIS